MMTKRTYYFSEGIGTFVMMLIGFSAIMLDFGTAFMAEEIASAQGRFLLVGGVTLVIYWTAKIPSARSSIIRKSNACIKIVDFANR